MKKNNKKGFTIVELVIVIAVIGILAAVLIPTFSDMITKANNSADLQNIKNAYTEYVVVAGEKVTNTIVIKYNNAYYTITNGVVPVDNEGKPQTTNYASGTYFCAKCKQILTAEPHTCS